MTPGATSSNSTPITTDTNGRRPLKVKEFVQRESLFRVLYEKHKDAQSLYGFVGAMIYFYITIRVMDHLRTGSFDQDARFLYWSFCENFVSIFLVNWLMIQSFAIGNYYLTKEWFYGRIPAIVYRGVLTVGLVSSFYIPCRPSVWKVLSPTLRAAIAAEHLRMCFKVVAFSIESLRKVSTIRSQPLTPHNSDRRVNTESDDEKEKSKDGKICTLKHFVYFLFAPTLVYRDAYPRSRTPTNWKRVFMLLVHFFIVIFIIHEVLQYYVVPYFEKIGREPMTYHYLMSCLFVGYLAGGTIMTIGIGYGFIHCWMNIWAEIFQFGDRQFYLDWWNQTNGTDFLRTWNLVVGEWIFEYIYIPLVKSFKWSKPMAAATIFTISALLHDYLFTSLFNFFLPAYTLTYPPVAIIGMFAVAVMAKFTKNMSHIYGNMTLHMLTYFSWSLWIIALGAEYYSRKNCPNAAIEATWKDTFTPRMFSCIAWA